MTLGHSVRLVPFCLEGQVLDREAIARVCEAVAERWAEPVRQPPATMAQLVAERVAMRAELEDGDD